MSNSVEYKIDKSTEAEIAAHLEECSAEFIPRLSDRVEIKAYAMKIATNAARFEAWSDGRLVGLVAAYCNDYKRNSAFVTSVSLLRPWMGKGIAADLLSQCIEYVKVSGIGQIRLDVAQANSPAIKLYVKNGFAVSKTTGETVEMNLYLN